MAVGTAGNRASPSCQPGQALSITSGLSIVGILGSVSTGNISVTTSLVSANGMYLGRAVSVSFFTMISSSDESNDIEARYVSDLKFPACGGRRRDGFCPARIEKHFPVFKLMSRLDHVDDLYRHKDLL
jgi:hypothetical protein